MRLVDALNIIAASPQHLGYRVAYEKVEGGMLRSGYFPDRDEDPLEDEESAWFLAKSFAQRTYGRYVNIYVVHADDWTPVSGYKERMIVNRASE